jgi:stress-induced morphogen
MPVTPGEIEAAVRAAIQVTHIKVEDNSGSCGDNYSVLIVSKVSLSFLLQVRRGRFIQLQ